MTEEPWKIKENWEWVEIKDLGEIISGGTPSTKEASYWGNEVNWISPSDLTGYTKKTISKGAKNITLKGLKNSSARVMPAGSIHFSSRAPIGYVVISSEPISTNQGFKSLVPSEGIYSDYVYYYLKSAKQLAERVATGTTFKEISGTAFGKLPFPLPPTNEQKRIVAKIEELFSELDKGIENLKTARAQLKVYRQALLKQAFEGNLTAHWREQNKDKLESADQLLERINIKKYNKDGLPELPSFWQWIKSGNLFSMVTSGSRGWAKYYSDSGALFIRIGNMDFDCLKLDLSDPQYVSLPESAEGKRTKVQEGDFLFSITGYLGMFAISQKLDEAYVNQHIALARPIEGFNKEYVGYYIIAKTGGHFHLNGLTKGAVKAGLRLDDIRSFPVPFCGLLEQEKVVEILKERLSIIDNVEQTIDLELQKSQSLRQSILKKAFSGQLVAQNPKDEPAHVLLEHIRAEKTSAAKTKTKRRVA